MQGRPVIIRTLDLGGDKKPSYLEFPNERSPVLGLRGIRFSLKNPILLETQLSAILRASAEGNVSIMFPMISTMNELNDARQIADEAKRKLESKGGSFSPNFRIGIMIETPSAALIADKLADKADFFSIGTNDLVQYTLAADRENQNVAAIADPLEPSVLRLIDQTIKSAHIRKLHVAVCGEMAADLEAVPLLVGLGLDELSVLPSRISITRKMIQSIRFSETEIFAAKALSMNSAAEVRNVSRKMFQTDLMRQRETT
jgi:phosphoenolpyruvate-protein kinase (PTS system EI component)